MKLTQSVILITAIVALTACGERSQQAVEDIPHIKMQIDFAKVKGFEDCMYYKIDPGGPYPDVVAIRCPNSTTSTIASNGKSTSTTVVIDGKEYVQKDSGPNSPITDIPQLPQPAQGVQH